MSGGASVRVDGGPAAAHAPTPEAGTAYVTRVPCGGGFWIACWYDHMNKRHFRSTRATDKRDAERIMAKHVNEAALRSEGVVDTDLDADAAEARRPIGQHIADYGKGLRAKRSVSHADLTIGRIEQLVRVAEMQTWLDMSPSAVEKALAKIAHDQQLSPQTVNAYRTAAHGFGAWMVRQKRVPRNPIANVDRLETEEREHRRAMEPEEVALLCVAAASGETLVGRDRTGNVRWTMTGRAREALYRLACETGLRRGAIERLVVGDFDTDALPTVTVRPQANTKNRKLLTIPLRRQTADLLHDHLRGKLPKAKAFDMPAKWETAKLFRTDLEVARAAWIQEGSSAEERAKRAENDFLAALDAEGRRLDFHALRTTCGTLLDRAEHCQASDRPHQRTNVAASLPPRNRRPDTAGRGGFA